MKKALIILSVLLLICSCGKKEEPTVADPPVEPAPAPDPVPEPAPTPVVEKVYVLEGDWITYDFRFKDDAASYELSDDLTLSFKGKTSSESYCQSGSCVVYDDVTANGKHIELFENMYPLINQDYGHLYAFNLNDELYLLAFDPIAQYTIYMCVVIDSEGNTVEEFDRVGLTMNTEYQNQFLISWFNEQGIEERAVIYTANGKTLDMKDF